MAWMRLQGSSPMLALWQAAEIPSFLTLLFPQPTRPFCWCKQTPIDAAIFRWDPHWGQYVCKGNMGREPVELYGYIRRKVFFFTNGGEHKSLSTLYTKYRDILLRKPKVLGMCA